ncbi:MAG: ABC transporter permease [Muribaculaceae bacterium]|nr:ABC transporter permease [Muribaculaceae bacterium]
MKHELFIASRLKLGNKGEANSRSLNVAGVGIILAIIIMILSVVIVLGFKKEITSKVTSLDPHIKVYNGAIGLDNNFAVVDFNEIANGINSDPSIKKHFTSISLIAEKPAILKTDDNFKGLQFRGVDANYDFSFLERHLVKGRVPRFESSDSTNEIIVSSIIAKQLMLDVNDRIFTYFIDDKVKVRKCNIVGIFNTDFDAFDKVFIVGNIALLQSVNGWQTNIGNYVGINIDNISNLDNSEATAYQLFSKLAQQSYNDPNNTTLYNVSNTKRNNLSYFTWLSMLDMNVIIILTLMIIVSSFTLISALLMVVLERIKMIGLFKALGATNTTIRHIFIFMTHKIIFKSMIIGNVLGIGLALLQKHFHILKLNPDAYYMNYVPIDINIPAIIILNIAILVISYITLIGPSYIISSIKPTSTMRFE